MSKVPKSAFWIIFAVVFIDLLGFGIVFPFLPIYARDFNISETRVAWILGIYSLMQFIFAPILGKLSDRYGRRPILLISMAGTALSFFMLAWAKSFWWFFLARALDGIAGSNISTAQACIADMSPREQRTRNIGMWFGAAFGLGFAFGPFLGGAFYWAGQQFFAVDAFSFPFLVAGVLSTLNFIAALFLLPETLPLKEDQHAYGTRTFSIRAIMNKLASPVGVLMITYAIVIFGFAQMEATFTWLAQDRFKLSQTGIYAMFGYLGIVVAFVQGGLVRRLAPKMGDKNLTLAGAILMAIGLAMMPFYAMVAWLIFTSGVMSVGHSFCSPALLSSISKGVSDTEQGETLGVTQSLASLARFVGPVTAGYLYQHYGFMSPYLFSAAIILLAAIAALPGFKKLSAQTAHQ